MQMMSNLSTHACNSSLSLNTGNFSSRFWNVKFFYKENLMSKEGKTFKSKFNRPSESSLLQIHFVQQEFTTTKHIALILENPKLSNENHLKKNSH